MQQTRASQARVAFLSTKIHPIGARFANLAAAVRRDAANLHLLISGLNSASTRPLGGLRVLPESLRHGAMSFSNLSSEESQARPGSDVLRMAAVVRRTGLCRSTIYRLVARKKFPAPLKLSGRAIGWREADLDQWSSLLPPAAH
jgi:prophage regulatory protein